MLGEFRTWWRRKLVRLLKQNKLELPNRDLRKAHTSYTHLVISGEFVKYRPSPGLLNQSLWRMGASDLLLLYSLEVWKHCVGLQEKLA